MTWDLDSTLALSIPSAPAPVRCIPAFKSKPLFEPGSRRVVSPRSARGNLRHSMRDARRCYHFALTRAVRLAGVLSAPS
jgi:hypothetical protein